MSQNEKILFNRRGAMALLFGLLLLPLIGFVGLAIDTSRGYAVKHRLQEAIDAAALAGAKNFDATDRDAIITSYFEQNWRDGFHVTDRPVINIDADSRRRTVSVTAVVHMDTLIMPAIGGQEVIEIGSINAAYKDISFVELAIALDTTTSMRLGTGASSTIQPANPADRRINIMKAAAITFVNGLYTQSGVLEDRVDNLRISLIPFTSMVNVGSQHTNFLASGSLTGLQWDYPKGRTSQDSWRGCVFERSFYSNLATGGFYPGNDVKDTSPAVEPFYPYNVAPQHMEVGWNCGALPAPPGPVPVPAPAPAPGPVPPPPPPPPPPPICVDGVCHKHLMVKPVLGREMKSDFETISFRLGQDGMKPSLPRPEIQKVGLTTPGGVCVYGPTPTGWWASYTLYAPAYSVEGQDGIWAHANSYDTTGDSIGDGVFSAACMPGTASPLKDNCNLLNPFGGGWNQLRSCCTLSGMNAPNFYGPSGWTKTGRWIAPWPSTASPKLGGWGNSGCGMPMVPLTGERLTVINAINALEVPLERSGTFADGKPLSDLGYSGTLINEGLVWAWRSISPNWRGYWKDSSGTAIDGTLPRSYDSAGSSKAVVVMTDGLNFLPARDIRHNYPTSDLLFEQKSVFTSDTTYEVPWPMAGDLNLFRDTHTLYWDDVDSSAYGVLHIPNKEVEFCNMRTSKGFEPMLTAGMGCRPYACMIRNAAGACLKTNFDPWAPNWRDALIGPYYNELLSRLVTTCTNMRAQGVRVFFILFALDDNPQKASTMAALDSCVGSSGKVYDAADAAELNTAFADILAQIRRLSLMH